MRLKLHIHYITKFGENLFVKIENREFAMHYAGSGFWSVEISEIGKSSIKYFYFVKDSAGKETASEWRKNHTLKLNHSTEVYEIHDIWYGIGNAQPFYSAAFTNIVNKRNKKKCNDEIHEKILEFRVNAPTISKENSLAITGNGNISGNWINVLKMHDDEFPLWKIKIDAAKLQFPFEFKFVLVENKTDKIIAWEEGNNRRFYANNFSHNEHKIYEFETSLANVNSWRGAGTAIPVFSLRTENSCGAGDFCDLKIFVDWLKKTGQVLLQILPVNDSCAFFDHRDSSPYNAISMYALHPVYINLQEMGKLSGENQLKYEKIKNRLNKLKSVDYAKVIKVKWMFFKELFRLNGNDCLESASFKQFFNENSFWLKPYAMFCVLRDKFKTPDFNTWKNYENFKNINTHKFEKEHEKAIRFYFFLQYHADRQMKSASKYAHKNGIILKGDIPIGIARNSVETWTEPEYFNLENQAGSPPDAFATKGQNWEFPTYNWNKIHEDSYSLWIKRLKKMAEYFDAFRIDHILGFFRMWEIPLQSLQGLLGRFNPAFPYSAQELQQCRLPINSAYLKPCFRYDFICKMFAEKANCVIQTFFDKTDNDILQFKPDFDTQRKIDNFFKNKHDEQTETLKSALFSLINDVLFIEDEYKKNHFHPRIAAQSSTAYRQLDNTKKQIFNSIYDEFYYSRNNELWKSEAMKKLPALIGATNMLACCEDLGMRPDCVPEIINRLQIMSLEIQRMPKNRNADFGNAATWSYHSVCTTSTHDTSTLRCWWKEDRTKIQKYYNEILHLHGEAPVTCSGAIIEMILTEHLKSPSLFAVFPLQDWLAVDENIRRKNEDEERINIPANISNCWQYRMHITIENLMKEDDFNAKIKKLASRKINNET
ncbi:MAG: 4-alpha-glucanotransferase [Prevotellaceae bacterium]|jgi:4-alpha-glucanotransferase|nr:4-alpha-glucanotransferase [Prevotellaceae bacterium]